MSLVKQIRTRRGTLITKTTTGYRYRAVVDGRQHYFPLGVDTLRAKERADDIRDHLKICTLEEVRSKFHPKYANKKTATVKNIIKAHKDLAPSLGLKPRTAKEYHRAIVRMVSLGLNVTRGQALAEKASVLTESLAQKVKSQYSQNLSSKRTYNALLRNAKGMFSRPALSAYRSYDPTWDFRFMRIDFLESLPYNRVKAKWNCPPETLIKDIAWNIENVAGGELYGMLALAFYGGLRCSEVANFSTHWVNQTSPSGADDVRIDILASNIFKPKGRQGYTIMKKSQYQRILDRRTTYGSCIMRYRNSRVISKKASTWLRKVCGLDVQKPFHELRKICGAHFATKHGLYTAQQYLRHEDPKTTYDHYAGVLLSDDCLTAWDK